jgi:urea transport system permease protein
VPQVGIINPGEFAPANSIEVVIWVAVGGRGTLVGAALGAVIVNYLKTVFTIGALAPYWLFVLGALFVLVTIFLPRGVLGLLPGRKAAEVVPDQSPPAPATDKHGAGAGKAPKADASSATPRAGDGRIAQPAE